MTVVSFLANKPLLNWKLVLITNEKNKEFVLGLKEKGIRLTKQALAKVLITDNPIYKLVQQLAGSGDEKRINYEGSY